MPYSLQGKNVLITGGSRGLGAEIARKFAARGAHIAINYASNESAARALAAELQAAHPACNTTVVAGDAGKQADCARCVQHTISTLGGLDILIANAGWTRFSDFGDLEALSEAEWDRCWATNVKGPKFLLAAALPTFRANGEGGAMIVTGSVAGQSLGGSSMAYCVTKAAQIHLVKCLAQTQGRVGEGVRVNVVLPGLLLTEWGREYGEERIAGLRERAVLGKETDLGDCADMFVAIAQNGSMTGQAVTVDSGINVGNM